MKHLARLVTILCLPCLLGSCGFLGRMFQGPTRLIQSAGRTFTTTEDASQIPASHQEPEASALALKVTPAK